MRRGSLKCPECGFEVLRGETVCDSCQRVFSDDDVQQMLDESRRVHRSPKERIRRMVPVLLVIIIVAAGLGYFGYRVRGSVEKYQTAKHEQFVEYVGERLSSVEEIESFTVEDGRVSLQMKHFLWVDIDENDKSDWLKQMQLEFTQARNQIVSVRADFVTVEVTDLAGNFMGGIDGQGSVHMGE